MSRRRYVQINGELHEADTVESQSRFTDARCHIVGDRHYDGLRAPDSERTDISSRAKHRAYMKARDLTTMDDYTEFWKKKAKDRERALAGHDPTRKEDIADVLLGRRTKGW